MKNPRTKLEMERLAEGSKDEITKSMLRSADPELVNNLRMRYYGVSDHINELVRKLNVINGDTGEFGKDLTLAKAMLKSFDKISLGKFL